MYRLSFFGTLYLRRSGPLGSNPRSVNETRTDSEFPRLCSSGRHLPARTHGLLSSQRHWRHARVGIGNALVGGGLRHHHRRRRVKRLSVQSCKCARKASGCSRGAPSRSRCAACTRSRVTVQTKARSGSFHGATAVGVDAEAAAAKAGASTRASARSAAARARARSCGRVQRPRLFGAMRTPPRAADERRLGGRLGGRWPTRETVRPLAPSVVRDGAACAPMAAFGGSAPSPRPGSRVANDRWRTGVSSKRWRTADVP